MPVAAAAIDQLVGLVYDCVPREERIPDLLRDVALAFDALSTVLMYVDPVQSDADFQLAYGVIADPAVQLSYRRYAAIDPAPAALSNLRLGQAASTDLLFATTMDRHREFIEGFLHSCGLAGTLAGVVANEGGRKGFFALHRGMDRRMFDETDIATFEKLLPHVAKMLSLRRAFFQLESVNTALRAALDPMRTAVMSLDPGGCLTFANVLSRTILARDDGLYLDRFGRLLALDRTANDELRALREGVAIPDAVVRVPRTDRFVPYVLRIVDKTSWQDCPAQPVTVYLSDPDMVSPVDPEPLAKALRLRPASARLVVALLEGDTLETYAERAEISRHTAKFHLRSAFAATGTRRQSELLRLAGRVSGDLML